MKSLVDVVRESDSKSAFEDLTGGGGSASAADAQVDFGSSGRTSYVEVVVVAAWAAAGTNILVRPGLPTTADHDPEDALLEALVCSVVAINPGVGFTVGVSAPEGTWGRYDLVCIGV